MANEQRIVELVIDGSGTEAGINRLNIAYDHLGDRSAAAISKAQVAMASQLRIFETNAPLAIDKAAAAYDKLRAKADPVLASQLKLETEMTRSMGVINRAILLGVTTEADATRQLEQLRDQQIVQLDQVRAAHDALANRTEVLRSKFDGAYVASNRLTDDLRDLAEAERLNIQISGGYEAALDALVLKHDAVAAAARRQSEEYAQLAKAGREAYAADQAQRKINEQLGIAAPKTGAAAQSGALFDAELSRQEEMARLRAEQNGLNFQADVNARLGVNDNGTSARASAAAFEEEARKTDEANRTIKAQQDDLTRLKAEQNGQNFQVDVNSWAGVNGNGTSARGSASVFEDAARDADEMSRKVEALRAEIDPLGAAQAKLNAELADYDNLARKAGLSSDELAKAQALSLKRYSDAEKDIKRQGKGGLPGYQLNNLMYQGADVAQSLALGMPVSQVALQQGPQIAQIFAAGGSASIKGVLSTVGATGGVIAGVVTALALGAKAWSDYLASIKPVETAANGVGRAVAGSASAMEASAEAGASAANISIKAARSMEAQFLQTGKIGSENYEKLIGVSSDFATTIGADAGTIGQTLAQMFSDPAAAAQTLSRQYGLIDAKTAEYATNLASQNRLSEAQTAILDALPARLSRAAEATTVFGRRWAEVGSFAHNAYDWIGKSIDKAVDGPTLSDQIAAARQRLQAGQAAMQRPEWLRPSDRAVTEPLETLNTLGPIRRRAEEQEALRQALAQRNQAGLAATDIANQSPANSVAMQKQSLQNDIVTLQAKRGGTDPAEEERINKALEAKKSLLDALDHQQQRLAALDRMDIQIQNEKDPLMKAELTEQRSKIALSLQEGDITTKNLQAQRDGNDVINAAIAAGQAQAKDMQEEITIRQNLNAQVAAGTLASGDAQSQLEKELAIRPLVLAAATAEAQGKTELNRQLLDSIKQLSAGYDGLADAQKVASANDYLRSQDDNLEKLRLQKELIGQNESVQQKANAALEAEQQIRSRGLATDSDLAKQIRDRAQATADLTDQVRKQSQAWDEVQKSAEGAIDTTVDSLSKGDLKGGLKSIADDFQKTALDLAVKNPLKNAMLGTDYGTAADIGGIGGIVTRLFGGKKDPASLATDALGKSVGTMSVNAGTVMVNGGVAGGLGSNLLGDAANSNFAAAGLTKTGVPLSLINGGDGLTAKVDTAAASRFQGLLDDLKGKGYPITSLGEGGYSFRNVAGTDHLSRHAFGDAIDINPAQNRQGYGEVGNWSQYGIDPTAEAKKFGLTYGGNWNKPDTMHFQVDKSADLASTSLTSFAKNTNAATTNLGGFGDGLGKLGSSLGSIQLSPNSGVAAAGQYSGLWGGIGKLFGGINPTSSFWAPNTTYGSFLGLADGGRVTGPGGPTDDMVPTFLSNGEHVTRAAMVKKWGPLLDAINADKVPMRLARGGHANGSTPAPYAGGPAAETRIEVHNYSGAKVETQETTDERGGRQIKFIMSDAVGDAISTKGGGASKTMQRQFGLKSQGIRR